MEDFGDDYGLGKNYKPRKARIVKLIEAGVAKMCNCAGCGKALLGACHRVDVEVDTKLGRDLRKTPPVVAARVNDKPYCSECLN